MAPAERESKASVQFTLRLPGQLHDNLTRDAARAGTTLTALIIRRLERSQSEAEAERQWRYTVETAREASEKLVAIRHEISTINAMINHLQPEHTMVLALANAQALLNQHRALFDLRVDTRQWRLSSKKIVI